MSPRPQSPASPPVVNDEDAEENCHEMVFIDSEKRPGADKLPSGSILRTIGKPQQLSKKAAKDLFLRIFDCIVFQSANQLTTQEIN